MITKTANGKGRLTLGSRFANQTVIVDEVDATKVRITLAQVIPKREVWLHKTSKTKAAVLRGLQQAKAGKLAKSPPDLENDEQLAKRLATTPVTHR